MVPEGDRCGHGARNALRDSSDGSKARNEMSSTSPGNK